MNNTFGEKDKEIAKEYVVEYLLGNNKQEQLILDGEYKKHTFPTELLDICTKTIDYTYSNNICHIANCLRSQDAFFSNYMPHWNAYIDALGLKGYCHYIKTRDIVVQSLISCKNQEDAAEMIIKNKELTNPFNIFYKGYFTIQNCKNRSLIEALDKVAGNNIERDFSEPCDVTIKVLPAESPLILEGITRILHRYL